MGKERQQSGHWRRMALSQFNPLSREEDCLLRFMGSLHNSDIAHWDAYLLALVVVLVLRLCPFEDDDEDEDENEALLQKILGQHASLLSGAEDFGLLYDRGRVGIKPIPMAARAGCNPLGHNRIDRKSVV